MLIDVKSYDYRQDGKFKSMHLPEGTQVGLIADQVGSIFPQLIKKTTCDLNELDAEGKPVKNHTPEEFEFNSVNYVGLIPVTIKSIQEQQTQIDELKKIVEAQQKQIQLLLNKQGIEK